MYYIVHTEITIVLIISFFLNTTFFYLSLMLTLKYLKTPAAVIGFSPLKLRAGSECRTESAKLAKTKAEKNVK